MSKKQFTIQQVIDMGMFPEDEVRKAADANGIVTIGYVDWE